MRLDRQFCADTTPRGTPRVNYLGTARRYICMPAGMVPVGTLGGVPGVLEPEGGRPGEVEPPACVVEPP